MGFPMGFPMSSSVGSPMARSSLALRTKPVRSTEFSSYPIFLPFTAAQKASPGIEIFCSFLATCTSNFSGSSITQFSVDP